MKLSDLPPQQPVDEGDSHKTIPKEMDPSCDEICQIPEG